MIPEQAAEQAAIDAALDVHLERLRGEHDPTDAVLQPELSERERWAFAAGFRAGARYIRSGRPAVRGQGRYHQLVERAQRARHGAAE